MAMDVYLRGRFDGKSMVMEQGKRDGSGIMRSMPGHLRRRPESISARPPVLSTRLTTLGSR